MAVVLTKHAARAFQSVAVTSRPHRIVSNLVPHPSQFFPENRRGVRFMSSISSDIDELNAKIKAKGDQIRQLKADGVDKATLAPHVEELIALKAQLPVEETTQDSATKSSNNKQQQQPKTKAAPSAKKVTEELSESELRLNRIAKVQAMRDAKVEPFEYTFECTRTASQLSAEYEGRLDNGAEDELSDVSVAGRIMTRRVFGKLAFFSLQDETGIVQLQFDKTRLGDSFQVR